MIYPSEWDLKRFVINGDNPFLFHYTTYSSALGILISQQMRMGSLANMNDPLEFENHRGDGLVFSGNPSNKFLAKKISEFENAVAEKDRAVRLVSLLWMEEIKRTITTICARGGPDQECGLNMQTIIKVSV